MRRTYVADLRIDDRVKQDFLLREVQIQTTRRGDTMLRVRLADRTGSINGIMHNPHDGIVGRLRDSVGAMVTGYVSEYHEQVQISIDSITPIELTNLADFLPPPRHSMDEMTAELDALIDSINDPHLALLLAEFFADKTFYDQFISTTAATRMHHACYGGLLEHTLAVCRIASASSELYPEVDHDLVMSIALLHDLGKVKSYDPVTFQLTDEGRLLGHINIEFSEIDSAIGEIEGFPPEMRLRVLHGLLASHGRPEWGSPVAPMTLEAMIVFHADSLVADVRGAIDHFEREGGNSTFTERSMGHGNNRLYRGENYDNHTEMYESSDWESSSE